MDQGFRGTNLQNLPRGRRFGEGPWIREMIVPAPGKKFFVADWNSMELRCLAQVCLTLFGTSNMARRYQDDPGYDPHLDFAARLLGRDPPEVLDKEWKDMRQLGKVANFGVPGGMSARTLVKWAWAVYRVEITPGQAQELIDRFLLANPVMREYFALVNDLADRELTQLYSGRVRGGASYCATANSFFQGLGADVLKQALWDARDLYLVMQTHDEIVGESSEPEQDLARLIEIMERPYLPDVPLVAEGQVMERFGK
jgi:DNA polymerase I-like protein with 3'-5' exonuclease and polymerase domains